MAKLTMRDLEIRIEALERIVSKKISQYEEDNEDSYLGESMNFALSQNGSYRY